MKYLILFFVLLSVAFYLYFVRVEDGKWRGALSIDLNKLESVKSYGSSPIQLIVFEDENTLDSMRFKKYLLPVLKGEYVDKNKVAIHFVSTSTDTNREYIAQEIERVNPNNSIRAKIPPIMIFIDGKKIEKITFNELLATINDATERKR